MEQNKEAPFVSGFFIVEEAAKGKEVEAFLSQLAHYRTESKQKDNLR